MNAARRLPPRPGKGQQGRSKLRYVLRLYVAGMTPSSSRVIAQVHAICDQHLPGRYDLEVIDIYQLPALAKGHQIVATPTLIRLLPGPLRRFIGDMSDEQVVFGMDLRKKPA